MAVTTATKAAEKNASHEPVSIMELLWHHRNHEARMHQCRSWQSLVDRDPAL
jgi:hypothetical protein